MHSPTQIKEKVGASPTEKWVHPADCPLTAKAHNEDWTISSKNQNIAKYSSFKLGLRKMYFLAVLPDPLHPPYFPQV